jgi:putative transposase
MDCFPQYAPVLGARFRYRGEDVVETLDRLCGTTGYPKTIRINQGSRAILRHMDPRAYQRGVSLVFPRFGKPTWNAFLRRSTTGSKRIT